MLKWLNFKRVLSIAVSSALAVSVMSFAGYEALAEDATPNEQTQVNDNYEFEPYFSPSTFILYNQDAGKADKWGQVIDKKLWWTWSQDADQSWAHNVTLDTNVLCEGKNSIYFVNSGGTRNTHADVYFLLKPNHTYTLSVYVKTDGPLGGQDLSSGIYVNYSLYKSSFLDAGIFDTSAITAATLVKDASFTDQKGKKVFQDFEKWEQLKATFTTPAETSVGMVGLYLWNNSGRTYFSNLQLKDGDVAWDNPGTPTSQSDTATSNTETSDTSSDSPEIIATVPETASNDNDDNNNPNTSDSMPYHVLAIGFLSVSSIAVSYSLRKKKRIQ